MAETYGGLRIIPMEEQYRAEARRISEKLKCPVVDSEYIADYELVLRIDDTGLSLIGDGQVIRGDFTTMLPRLKQSNLEREMLVKAARIKKADHPLTAIDATAGLGEDAILLAAAGYDVTMYELNAVIAELLQDAVRRAQEHELLCDIAARMHVIVGDSCEALRQLETAPDVIVLDPMFPAKQKNALMKKKFQVIHKLEKPCDREEELLEAAFSAHPKKIVVKRPVKGPFLAGRKPNHSLSGKAIRYDCFVNC